MIFNCLFAMIIFLKENLSWFLKKKKKKENLSSNNIIRCIRCLCEFGNVKINHKYRDTNFFLKIKKKKKKQNKIEKKKNSLLLKFFSISSI